MLNINNFARIEWHSLENGFLFTDSPAQRLKTLCTRFAGYTEIQ